MRQGQLALECVLKFLVEENEGNITLFYPEDYIKRLEFIKKNINTQIDKLILTEETNAI
tara:strand:- start:304 stop:480 length:177 start_codon:yes stop_codon:yes gene_type:complete